MAVTPAQFKTAKPQFADVPDPTVQAYLDLAALVVDDTWSAKWRDQALIAYTCHLMTLEGLGTDAQSQGFASGLVEFETIRSGQLTLSRIAATSGGSSGIAQQVALSYPSWLAQTRCGRFFLVLLNNLRGGPITVSISSPGAVSGYAKDWPGVYAGSVP